MTGNHALSVSFIQQLFASRDAIILTKGISIENAVITGPGFLNLVNQGIPYQVSFGNCIFEVNVAFGGTHFAKGLFVTGSTFNESDFSSAIIDLDFVAQDCHFGPNGARFRSMRVGRDAFLERSIFSAPNTSFVGVRVGGVFLADDCKFFSAVSFDDMRVDGRFSAERCAFSFVSNAEEGKDNDLESNVSFVHAHFADFFLDGATFDRVSKIDFTAMQADLISLDGVQVKTRSDVKHGQMTFKLLRPMNTEKLQFLLSPYDAELYTTVESLFRTHGYPDEADKIFIAKRRAERRENCKSFLHECDRGSWAWSMFQDALAGYGRHLENLLYWSLGFLLIGILVFRNEKGMKIKNEKDASHYVGRYNAFWYGLDLFLPIIKLGEADVWTPKDDRRWANLYRKVHIIIGSLFVPIGLAAWTGIIK